MPAFGIEKLSNDSYRVIYFRYRWRMQEWVAQKPNKRRGAPSTSLDIHLTVKARKASGAVILRDTRRKKDERSNRK